MAFKVGKSTDTDEGTDEMAEINIIPLVDVMLVLLIIFMVTAPLSIGGIKVQLPNSKARTSSVQEDRIVLSITKGGEFFIEKMKVSAEALPAKFKAIYEYRKKKELYIRADTGVAYGRVIYAMSSAKLAGVTRLAMLTKIKTTTAGTTGN